MKKLLALAMALTLCLGLAACGGDTADAGTDTSPDRRDRHPPGGRHPRPPRGNPGAGGGQPG